MTIDGQSQQITALSDEEIEAIEEEVSHLPNRQAAAIDALKIVQAHRGWVSDASLDAVARLLEMSVEELDSIATFYNLIFRRPVGRNVILFCDSVTCWMMGGDAVCEKVSRKLGIGYGETTSDNRYTLLPVTCLGDCDHAPVMMVGESLHRNLAPETVGDIFDEGKDA